MIKRLRYLYDVVCVRREEMTVDSLAQLLSVSRRTIYNDIKRINLLLGSISSASVVINKGKPEFTGDISPDFNALFSNIELLQNDVSLRRNSISEYALTHTTFSIDDLANRFEVSRNVIKKDVANIKSNLEKFKIRLISNRFHGNAVEGDEDTIREYLASLFLNDKKYGIPNETKHLAVAAAAGKYVDFVANDLSVAYSDQAVERLIAVMIASYERIRSGKMLSNTDYKHQTKQPTREYKAIYERADALASVYGTSFVSDNELHYLAGKFSEAQIVGFDEIADDENWLKTNFFVRELISEVDINYPGFRLLEDDALFVGLLNHLRPAYYRVKRGEEIENPLFSFVLGNYSDLFHVVKHSVTIFERELDVLFSDDEVSFFVLFFAAAFERREKSTKRVARIIIVCSTGLSTSQILKSKIESMYNVLVLGTYGVCEAEERLRENDIDFVISTVPFSSNSCEVLCVVSPTLNDEDRRLISARLGVFSKDIKLSELVGIIDKYCVIPSGHRELLINDLSRYLGDSSPKAANVETGPEYGLDQLIDESLIQTHYIAADWRDAVKETGLLLVRRGIATSQYTDAMIENIEKNGTYVVVAPGIAIPHADPKKGALGTGFSIVTLASPVEFGHPANDPVWLLVGLCSSDHHSYLKALRTLYQVLGDRDSYSRIIDAASPEEIIKIISSYM